MIPMRALINYFMRMLGYSRMIPEALSFDYDEDFEELYEKTKEYTMTSSERMYAIYKAIEYLEVNNIQGDIVECGVWRGGSIMLTSYALKRLKNTKRNMYLFDTFAGMTEPSDADKTVYDNASARDIWNKQVLPKGNEWCYASIDDVKSNVYSTGYPKERFIFVKGDVVNTLKKTVPNHIALLRLDTDWYKSTKRELEVLFPRLVHGGVIIIDDYGHWKGAREAVDEYFSTTKYKVLLNRIDYSGRIGVKL